MSIEEWITAEEESSLRRKETLDQFYERMDSAWQILGERVAQLKEEMTNESEEDEGEAVD